ncbi:DUF4132 domain-containing protein [Actinomadura sp. LOL_016]|uniref:DUF4132 domain-containing protein n=1 Tax=unclassified Actinomadura TaxID=2626254 RepID=UPI003A807D42
MIESIPNEDVLELPRSWKRHLHPRRGGWTAQKVTVAALDEAELRSRYAGAIEAALAHRATDPALAEAGRRHLAGEASPLGAAVVAAIPESEIHFGETTARFADAWVSTYGLPFAVHAFVERCDLRVGSYGAAEGGLARDGSGFDGARLADAAKRLRVLLAGTGDAEYREVVGLLAGVRTSPLRRMLAAYLVPTEAEWVAGCCAEPADAVPRQLLLRSLGSAEHFAMLGPERHISVVDCYSIENLVTLAEGAGPMIAPYLAQAFDAHHENPRRRKALLDVLGRLPTDEAFRLMLERAGNAHMRAALRETMRRYPVRALRVLATAAGSTAAELLLEHVHGHADLVARVLPELPEEVRAAVEKPGALDERGPGAGPDELPRVLLDPPWARAKPEPVVLEGLPLPGERSMAWAPGERGDWRRTTIFFPYPDSWHKPSDERGWGEVAEVPAPQEPAERWERFAASFNAGKVREDVFWLAGLFAMGPEDLVRPLLRGWVPDEWERPGGYWSPETWLRVLIARFDLDALPVALRFARAKPARGAELLLPYLDGDVADAMAGWLLRTKSARGAALAWFERHGPGAARRLVPVALGKPGKAREAAEHALPFLDRETVLDAARAHGARAVELVEALLDENAAPRRKIPKSLDVEAGALPPVLLRGRERALPLRAVETLLTLLAISTPEEPHPELADVLDACDPASLAEFGWELYRHWGKNGGRSEHAWQFSALGRLGNDDTVRVLIPLIRVWPGDGGHHLAVRGLDAVAGIGSELALREVHGIAQTVKYKGLRKHAQEKVEQIAAARGLTPEELGDRLVPDFGLDATGALALDYGPRRFTAGFDAALKPYVVDESGKVRANLPKPGVRDDPELAPAAHRRFAELKKDVRAIAGVQLGRMERAMATGRRWSVAEFREFFVEHPLMWHLARRLVWIAEDGGAAKAFRIAEDRTFADAADAGYTPPDGAAVTIAHPVRLGNAVRTWARRFDDYEIAQPFRQLDREVHALTARERAGDRLARFEGTTVPFGNVLRLERRGWRRGPVNSDGGIECLVRPAEDGRHVVVTLKTGLFVGYVSESGDQTLEAVWIGTDPAPDGFAHENPGRERCTFADLDPVTASEILGDLTAVVT